MPTNYDDIVKQALERYLEATEADRDERSLAIDDVVFAFSEDGQWEDLAKARRHNKPRYTINMIAPAINETIGNYRQNRIEMKARPMQDASKQEADTYNGLIRAILSSNNAELAKDQAFKLITTCGFGAVKAVNKYTDENPFEQDVDVMPIWDALNTVWFDPKAKDPTAKDGDYVFEEHKMTRKAFNELYPDASLSPWSDEHYSKLQHGWGIGDRTDDVKVVDYYVKEPVTKAMVLLSDGSIIDAEGFENTQDELKEKGIEFVDARDVETHKVNCYRMSGTEVLEPPVEVPSRYLPIIRVLGYYEWMNGTLHYRGIVRGAKDPQRVFNYATSANIESTALKPKDKVLVTKKMIAGHQSTWRNINNSDSPVLPYTPDDTSPDKKPIPFSGSQGTPELVQQAAQAQLDLQATIGRRAPAVGESPSDRSGRAILALQRQDDNVTFELLDNLSISWEQVGTVVMDMIPRIYDQERQVAILNDDGEETIAVLNEQVKDEETGKSYLLNDTTKRYRLKSSVGPAFETKRTEAVNVLARIGENPQFGAVTQDLLAKSLDFPFAEELTARMRKIMLDQGIVEPNEEELEERAKAMQTPEGLAQAQQHAQMQELQVRNAFLDVALKEAQVGNLQANIANLQAATMEKVNGAAKDNADIQETYTDVYTKQIDAIIGQLEVGLQPTTNQLAAIQQSLALLDATQRDEYQMRIAQALNKAQALQQSV